MRSVQGRRLVLYDFLETLGGAERVAAMLCGRFNADLVVGYRGSQTFALGETKVESLTSRSVNRYLRALRLVHAFRSWRPQGDPEWAIVSGIFAPFAIPRLARHCRVVYYCHTPPRFCHEDFESHFGALPGPLRRLARAASSAFSRAFSRSVRAAHRVVSNSHYTRERLGRFCAIDSEVVYPPSMEQQVPSDGPRDIYLSCARHEPYKRVDLVIEAFRGMPDRQLVVASTGSMTTELRRAAGAATNIHFVGPVDDAGLSALYARSIASLYLARGEDFGMSAVESLRHGTPVIAADEGGLREIVEPDRTGLLVLPSPDAVRRAVLDFSAPDPDLTAIACRESARRFGSDAFFAGVEHALSQ